MRNELDPLKIFKNNTANRIVAFGSTGAPILASIGAGLNLAVDGTLTATASGVSDGNKTDVTVSSSGTVWVINNSAVTFGKMQNISTNTILGRNTAGTGTIQALTPTAVTAMLNSFTTIAKGLVPAPNAVSGLFLKDDGSWAAPTGFNTYTITVSGATLRSCGTSRIPLATILPVGSFHLVVAAAYNKDFSTGSTAYNFTGDLIIVNTTGGVAGDFFKLNKSFANFADLSHGQFHYPTGFPFTGSTGDRGLYLTTSDGANATVGTFQLKITVYCLTYTP